MQYLPVVCPREHCVNGRRRTHRRVRPLILFCFYSVFPENASISSCMLQPKKLRERHQISGAHRPGAAGHDLAQDPRVDPGPAGELRRRQLFSRHPRAEDRRSRLKCPHASPPIRPAAGSSSADRCCPPAFHTHASAPGPARASGPTAPAASGSPRRHADRARR